jgi:hypothetical protein
VVTPVRKGQPWAGDAAHLRQNAVDVHIENLAPLVAVHGRDDCDIVCGNRRLKPRNAASRCWQMRDASVSWNRLPRRGCTGRCSSGKLTVIDVPRGIGAFGEKHVSG